jgi:hypothetical protein
VPGARARPEACFGLLLAALTASLARVAFIESHWDEDACVAIGWLVSRGWRLYSGVFTHHTPLDYLPSSLIASLFGPSPTANRAFMVALWAAVAAGLYAALRRRAEGERTAVLFAVLSSQWLTYWYGQMMLVENYWGYAAASALALLGSPLGLEPEPSPRRAAAVGALIALILTASPVCAPVAALLVLWAAADPRWRPHARSFALGAAAWLAFFGAWAAAHADLSLLWQHAVVFNRDVYAKFYGIEGGAVAGFWLRALEHNAAYFGAIFDRLGAEGWFETLIKLSAIGWAAWSLAERRWAQGAWKLAFVLALNARPEKGAGAPPFHAAPFYLVATLVAASALARAWGALEGRRRLVFALGAAGALVPTLWATSFATASLRPLAIPNPAYEAIVADVRACTAPEDRVAALPCYPRFYVDVERLPATPSVFYFPWQAAWEPQRLATMEALERERPKAVLIQEDTKVWGVPWREYGSGVEAWLAANGYAAAADGGKPGHLRLLIRPDAASAFAGCAAARRAKP